ncbi:MAG: hypothetical protein MK212_03390 [Saprospiraceae bacterium]|nr:hypothetical protein [Saprospiraceae bacterium]
MNNRNLLSLIFLSLFILTISSQAQTQKELEQNKNIVWAGEIFTDYTPRRGEYAGCDNRDSYHKDFPSIKGRSNFKWLKMQIRDINKTQGHEQDIVYQMFCQEEMKYTAYKTHELKDKYTEKEVRSIFSSVDTIIAFDPDTYEEIVKVVVTLMNPNDIEIFRLKQTIYYDYTKHQFISVPTALAPMITSTNNKGEPQGISPLLWIEVESSTGMPNLNDADITWAKRMYRNCEFKDIKIFKTEKTKGEIISEMVTFFRENSKTVELAATFDGDGNIMMKEGEKANFGASIDTIITFDPVTFTEKLSVVKVNIDGKNIDEMRLLQDWWWNDKEQKLYIRHAGFSPIIKRYDSDGIFLNSGPIFIRRTDFK